MAKAWLSLPEGDRRRLVEFYSSPPRAPEKSTMEVDPSDPVRAILDLLVLSLIFFQLDPGAGTSTNAPPGTQPHASNSKTRVRTAYVEEDEARHMPTG